jgi:hypothetical protein
MVRCSWSGIEYDERRVGKGHAILDPNVVHCFRKERDRAIEIMRHAIALNGAFFNTQRMVAQYLHGAYRLGQAHLSQSEGFMGH